MKNKTLAIIIVLLGVIAIFAKQDYAWVLSAIMIGIGSGLYFWRE